MERGMNVDSLSDKESLELLKKSSLGRLGCIADGGPYVVPVNYFYEDRYIYSHSTPGRKIEAMRANPRVCFQVDEIKDSYHWRSVIVYGVYEEILDEREQTQVMGKLFARLPDMTPVESSPSTGLKRLIVFRIKLDDITGRCEDW
jgi:nitroimidazol reductase NimA-like FMN-containing flavoprotein (pyridoxamine 5'-phosphate oxidase superfamily)